MRIAVAAAALVVVGAIEAMVSARQLETIAGRPQLGSGGLLLTAGGLLASTAVYLLLGRAARDERDALRAGAVAGALAGSIGGALRAYLVNDAVRNAVARYASVPDWFVPAALAVFVTLSLAASVIGGAALAWMGRRFSRPGPSRPPA